MNSDWKINLIIGKRLLFGILVLLILPSFVYSEDEKGWATSMPEKGRFVKVGERYMVPYQTEIPGTKVKFEMVPVAGGMTELSWPNPKDKSETIKLVVVVSPFWIGKHEVTWGEYNQFCRLNEAFRKLLVKKLRLVSEENDFDAVTTPSALYDESTYFPSGDKRDWPKYPATGMTQYASKQYTKWLSKLGGSTYRLPTEIEWEHACRAGSRKKYCFGDDSRQLDLYAWHQGNSGEDTHPVGTKRANAWGIHDMHGNVKEWCLDQYHPDFSLLKENISNGLRMARPLRIHPRTVRGGSWDSTKAASVCGSREGSSVDWQDEEPNIPLSPTWLASSKTQRQIGFRIVRPVRQPGKDFPELYWEADTKKLKEAVKIYTTNGHSYRGLVDPELPKVLETLK